VSTDFCADKYKLQLRAHRSAAEYVICRHPKAMEILLNRNQRAGLLSTYLRKTSFVIIVIVGQWYFSGIYRTLVRSGRFCVNVVWLQEKKELLPKVQTISMEMTKKVLLHPI